MKSIGIMNNFFPILLGIAAVFGVLGVLTGAFGAHFLKSRLSVEELEILKTGVLYLFIHTLALLSIVSFGKTDNSSRLLKTAGVFFVIGIIFFTGSLIILSTRHLSIFPGDSIGFITPVGGLFFIIGWVTLLLYSFTKNK